VDLIGLYKSHVLSYIEFATPAVYHAPDFMLSPVDRVQDSFLSELGCSAVDAILRHNLAPLSTRRDIAMLGLLHRITIGSAPPQFSELVFPSRSSSSAPRYWRHRHGRHDRQLHDPIDGTQSNMMQRSLFGLIYTYNMLPQPVIDAKSVSSFQKLLQNAVKSAARREHVSWKVLLRSGVRDMSGRSFQNMF
jgi:hypothetical protein